MTGAFQNDLFEDDDPFDDPLWQRAEEMVGAPPRPAKGYGVYMRAWLGRVLPIVRSAGQLAVALTVYSQCVRKRCRTIDLSNRTLFELGVSRQTKYRALAELQKVGAVSIEARNGRSVRVTLHWFP